MIEGNRLVQLEKKVQELERKLNEKTTKAEVLNEVQSRITNATGTQRVLSGSIQSHNFESGVTGWRLSSDGTLEATEGVFSGDIEGSTFTGISINGGDITGTTITGGDITGTTITGSRVRTNSSGTRVEMGEHGHPAYPDNLIFYNLTGDAVGRMSGGADDTLCDGTYRFNSGAGTTIRGVGFEGVLGYKSFEVYEEVIKSRTVLPLGSSEDLGSDALRWDTVYCNAVDTGDVKFDNGWILTESDKVGIEEEGMVFVNSKGEPICIINNNGIKNLK